MKAGGYVVAVVGAAGVVGREVCTVLNERGFPAGALRLFESVEGLGEVVDDQAAPVELIDRARLDGVDIVFMCATEKVSAEWTPRAVEANAVVIDLTQVFAEQADVPIVVPEVNPDDVADYLERRILTSPAPGAAALAAVLKPLDDAAGLKRVVVTALEPASNAGRAGIEELSRQTADLMSGRSVEASVFPCRVAFNLIPQTGQLLNLGRTLGEWQVTFQTRRLLDLPDLSMTVTSVQVPTFYGHGYAVNLETQSAFDAASAVALLRQAPGILLVDDLLAATVYPTLIDAVEHQAICVGRVRDDASVACGLDLWVTVDGTRKGSATNAVQIAEILVRDYL
jgi:aspartate-semialdehyde dehydrogenase